MDINKIAKKMTREEFLLDCRHDTFTEYDLNCPSDINLKEKCDLYQDCRKCWENAVKDIKFKGEDNMEFNWEGFKNNDFVVLCNTEEKAKDFVKQCYDKGIKWKYDSSENKTNWHIHEKDTCYVINDIYNNILNHCRIKFCIEQGFKIIEWEIDKMDYDREYNIVEIMEFPEGTIFHTEGYDFKVTNGELRLKDNTGVWILEHLRKGIITSKFKLAKKDNKDKKVNVVDAMKAFKQGKVIKVKHKNASTIYEPEEFNGEYILTDGDTLIPEEILNGEWYIKEY